MTEEVIVSKRRTKKSNIKFWMCIRDVKKCTSISEWAKKYPITYGRAYRKNWIELISNHNGVKVKKKLIRKKAIITYQECLEAATNYNTLTEWQKNDGRTYRRAIREVWINDIILESGINNNQREKKAKGIIKRVNFITFEMCVEDASKCNSITEWQKEFAGSYHVAYKRGWLNKILEEVGIERKIDIKQEITLEGLVEKASKFETIKEWREKDYKSYSQAFRAGYLPTIKNRVNFRPARFERDYTIDECAHDAKKHQSLHKWVTNGNLHYYAKYKNWIDIIIDRVGFQKSSSKKGWWYEM